MSDTTFCLSHDCPKAKQCYRHEGDKGDTPWQSYFAPNPVTCAYSIPLEDKPNE